MQHFQNQKGEDASYNDHYNAAGSLEIPRTLLNVFSVGIDDTYNECNGKAQCEDPVSGSNVSHSSLL